MPSAAGVRDQLGAPNLVECRSLAVRAINHAQQARPVDQMVATGLAVVAMAEAIDIDPHDVIAVARRAMHDAESPFTHQLQAIRDYARAELRIT